MSGRSRLLLNVTLLALALAVLWWGWLWARPAPVFDEQRFDRLVSAKRFDLAEAEARGILRRAPNHSIANLRLGELIVERLKSAGTPEKATARAQEALVCLQRARPCSQKEKAFVRLEEGKALYALLRWRETELAMKDALALDPRIPEAGWALLDLYYVQGRLREGRELALRLHTIEPNPHDQIALLVQLLRQDVLLPDPTSLIVLFEPVVKTDPEDMYSTIALGVNQVRAARVDDGLHTLEAALARFPNEIEVWEAQLTGLELGGQVSRFSETFARMPAQWANDPRFEIFRGRLAQERGAPKGSIAAYRRAWEHDPSNPVIPYRLSLALRSGGLEEESRRFIQIHADFNAARKEARNIFDAIVADEALARPSTAHVELFRRLADLRDQMLRPEEARAWRALADMMAAQLEAHQSKSSLPAR